MSLLMWEDHSTFQTTFDACLYDPQYEKKFIGYEALKLVVC